MSSSDVQADKATLEQVVIVRTPNSEKYHKMKLVDGEPRPMCNQQSNIHGLNTKYRVWTWKKPMCGTNHASILPVTGITQTRTSLEGNLYDWAIHP